MFIFAFLMRLFEDNKKFEQNKNITKIQNIIKWMLKTHYR